MVTGRNAVWPLLVVAWTCLKPALVAHGADLVGISISGPVYHIDPATGLGSEVATTQGGFNALGQDRGGRIVGVGTAPGLTELYEINPFDGSTTRLATSSPAMSVRGLAFSPSDVLYAIVDGGQSNGTFHLDMLYRVDATTGEFTLIGTDIGLTRTQGLEISADGTLYGWDLTAGLVTIDPVTGLATDVNPDVSGFGVAIQTLVFDSRGTLFGGRNELYTIDPATGVTTRVGGGGYSDVRGMALIAEPTTCGIGTFPPGPANCVIPPSQVNEAQGTLSVAMKWSCLRGAPACDDPSLVNEANARDMLLRRQERAAQCIWLPQCNITLRSAATEDAGLEGQFVVLDDFDGQVGEPGDLAIPAPQSGQSSDVSELLETWDAAAAAWGDVNKGVVAVSVNRIIDPFGRQARALVLGSPDTNNNSMGAMVTTPWIVVQDPTLMCEANERTLAKMVGRLLSLPRGFEPDNLMNKPAPNAEDSGVLLTAEQCQRARNYLATPEGLVLDPPLSVANETGEFFSDQVYDGLEDSVPQDEKYLDVLNSVVLDNGASDGEVVFCSGLGGLIPEQGPQGETEPICVAFSMDCDNDRATGDNAGQVVPGLDFPGAEFVAELLVDRQTGQVIPILHAATGLGFIEIEFEPGVFEGESVIGFIQVIEPAPEYDGPEFIPLTTEMRATLNSQLFADALAEMGVEADETGRTFPAGLRFQVTTSQGSGQSAVDTNPPEKEELEFEETVFPQLIVPQRVRRGETVTVSVTGMPRLSPLRAVGGTFTALIEPAVTDDDGAAEFDMTIPRDAPLGVALVTIGVDDESTAVTADGVLRVVDCPADIDGSGDLSVFDFIEFQNAWQAGQANADYDGDGELTVFDFLAFQNAFEQGCP